MAGGVAKLERLTVTVIDDLEVFASTSVTLPLVGKTAVASRLELLEPEVRTTDPGRMKRRDPHTNEDRSLDAGAAAFFQKPVDNNELLEVIRASLQLPPAPRQAWPS